MAEETTGIERTETGTIVDQTPPPEVLTPTTPPETGKTETTPPPDGKTLLTEGEKAKPEAKPDDKTAKTGAPEKYEDYKVPEGFELDPEVKTKADGLFKELGLSQDEAQKAVDFYQTLAKEAGEAPYKEYQEFKDNLRKEALEHPDLRGKIGPGQEVNVRIAKALDGLGDPKLVTDFKQFMDITGAGNSSAFIRVLDKLAQRVTEGTHVAGTGPSRAGQSAPNEAPPTVGGALWPKLPSSMDRR